MLTIFKKSGRTAAFTIAVLMASVSWMVGADAKSLTIGLTSDAVNLDPQAGEELSSNILFYHIYDPLVRRNADLSFGPGLAESWELTDDTTWVFRLRKGVKFHNGEEFKASDVVFTLDRLKASLMANLGANISEFRAIDDYTVEIKTPRPYAVLPNDLAAVLILNEKYAKEVGNEQLDLKPVGTGPYKLAEWIKEDHLNLVANADYFAGAPKIEKVTFRPITNGATRTAALLTGEVDVIQDVSVRDVDRIKADDRYNLLTQPSLLNIVISLDMRDKSPTIKLDKNPLKDQRVREAMVRAIDVNAIKKVIMNGLSTPSEQYVPSSHTGYVDGMSFRDLYPYDVAKATELMAAAGYPDGFTMTLDTTNNRYVNDAQIAQALASMLAKVKIDLKLNLMPKSNFFGYIRVPSDKSSMIMSGWDVPSGDAGSMYSVMFYSRGKKDGYGQVNRGSYSNPDVDVLIDKADATSKIDERNALLQDVTKILMKDIPMIPVHYEQDLYGAKKSVTMTPRADKFLWAYEIDIAE